jgi:hypothetical protein
MAASMEELVKEIHAELLVLEQACRARSWSAGASAARGILSATSRLHQRLRVLVDVGEDAGYAVAEVDRALARAASWHQTTVDEQVAEAEARAARAARKPRARKGKEGA